MKGLIGITGTTAFSICSMISTCYAGCLVDSEIKCGEERGDPFSHMDELLALEEEGKNDYNVLSFHTCDDGRKMVGIKFTLQSESNPNDIVELSPIGDMEALNC